MNEFDLGKLYLKHPNFNPLAANLAEDKQGNIAAEDLRGSARSLLVAALFNSLKTTHFIILPEKEDAAYFYNDLVSILGEELVFFFPSTYKRSIQYGQTEASNIVLRTEVMNHLGSGKRKCVVVSYPESVMEKVISKKVFRKNTLKIKTGDPLSMEFLVEVLTEYNFSRVDFVYEPGQFSVRGSIIDVFSYSSDKPYRIDFFGDDIESIRTFNIDDQLSIEKFKEVSIIPNVQDISIEKTHENITEFIPPSSLIWLDSFAFTIDKINSVYNSSWSHETDYQEKSKREMAITGEHLESELSSFRVIEFSTQPHFDVSYRYKFNTQPQPSFNKNFELLGERIITNIEEGYENIIVSESETQIARLRDIFSEINPALSFKSEIINLHRGFIDYDLGVALFTDHQIFDRYHKFRIRGTFNRRESLSIKEITGLNPGDYVVHIDHGIGRFGGLEKIDVNGKIQEVIKLVYRDNDILYVGIHALHRISKYKSKDSSEPRIYKLGSAAWQRIKSSTKKKVKDIAKDLILLYAKRMTVDGFSFSPDSFMQRELEASFIYEDTPDQNAATKLVKEDMEKSHPMDRLVCGDVGFGKTEIAVRAAFKSAADNKQVAILVPTTILALQHYQTFSQRLKDFPVEIDYISRHRKAADQRDIKDRLKNGKLDIIIGTHKLVAKDIEFKDLGLLVIDEEQKFGVSVKEKIKKFKANVDTLTLTATPIPRTLQFSLMGARDLSIINTPPPNRMPIITELHGFNEDIIKEGIEYELNRNGQVFFIHNRVENIREVQAIISRILPGVKSAIVHGQMDGRQVENKMYDFIHGDYDILIATTIIESGLDIPNANTIFINNAHHFGLSELHQLRGRVGRSNKKAFCYLLAPPESVMTQEARRRLKAIEEFSELGSGFNIAMQDLDIRGAGNLLGGEQSGFIADVGFETYQRILQEAINELKENELKGVVSQETKKEGIKEEESTYVSDCQIETDMEIMFPDSYVSNISERIRLYKKLNELQNESQLLVFEKELIDRFGDLPQPAIELLHLVRLRRQAMGMGVEKLILKKGMMVIHFTSEQNSEFYKSKMFISIINYVNKRYSKITVKHTDTRLSLTIKNILSIQDAKKIFDSIIQFHENLL